METICTLCNIDYSNRRSFLSHKRRFHKSYIIDNDRRKNEENNCYSCQYCKKEYTIAKSRWAHEQKCKLTESPENIEMHNQIKILQNETLRLHNETIKIQNDILKQKKKSDKKIKELQDKILNSERVENRAFNLVNKILMDRSSYNRSLNNNTNQIIEPAAESQPDTIQFQEVQPEAASLDTV